MENAQYGWYAYMEAYAKYLESRRWHPDLAQFYQRRYEVCRELIGVDLEAPLGKTAARRFSQELLKRFAEAAGQLWSPFDGLLEAPHSVMRVYNRNNPLIRRTFDLQRQNYLNVMADYAEFLWGRCPHTLTEVEMNSHGVGRGDEPEVLDYF
ncbi:MAG: hypothetical protein WAV90_10375 [Gordonia amarae]